MDNRIDKIHAAYVPSPIVSVLVLGRIGTGIEVSAGGAKYNFTGSTAVGGANVGNALAAIKGLVFEEQAISAETLEAALEANFVGYADVRSMLTERAAKFVDYVRVYFDLGGMHIQFNVITRETLHDAQAHPQEYRHLVVRVACYSTLFVNLSKDVQDQIIARTEHRL